MQLERNWQWSELTQNWMHDQTWLQNVHRVIFRPRIEPPPIHTFMGTGLICEGHGLPVTPLHRDKLGITLAHDILTKHVETVL